MKYTVDFPLAAVRTAEDVEQIARTVDRLGFDALAFTEHPAPSRQWLESPAGHPTFDLVSSLAFCAAVTERVRLMTFLAVLPYHRPFTLAKALATLDVLSRGRVTAVVGAGYLRAEFDALGVPFDDRNALFDEALSVLPEIWSGRAVTRSGLGFTAEEIISRPIPVQHGGPPLWIGGNGRTARERAASTGGWSPLLLDGHTAGGINTASITGVDELVTAIGGVRERARELRGEDAKVTIQVQTPQSRVMHSEHSADAHREHLSALDEGGVDWFIVRVPGTETASVIDSLEYYAADLRL
jgi:probable F420-dependent oxidoreductase